MEHTDDGVVAARTWRRALSLLESRERTPFPIASVTASLKARSIFVAGSNGNFVEVPSRSVVQWPAF